MLFVHCTMVVNALANRLASNIIPPAVAILAHCDLCTAPGSVFFPDDEATGGGADGQAGCILMEILAKVRMASVDICVKSSHFLSLSFSGPVPVTRGERAPPDERNRSGLMMLSDGL